MSRGQQAVQLGLSSNTVITILQPSSTIECLYDGSHTYTTKTGPFSFSSTIQISLSSKTIISGYATITPGSSLTLLGKTYTSSQGFQGVVVGGSSLFVYVVGTVSGLYTLRT